ncbi:MAG: carboxypeptidase regulatory-like domain-containing protein [Planctomycetota bacterium]
MSEPSRKSSRSRSGFSPIAALAALLIGVVACVWILGSTGVEAPRDRDEIGRNPKPVESVTPVASPHSEAQRTEVPVASRVASSALAGVVILPDGLPASGVHLQLSASDGETALEAARSDAGGHFAWRNIPAGIYRIRAELDDHVAEQTVAAPDEGLLLQLRRRLSHESDDVALRVRVLDEYAKPLREAEVVVTGDHGRWRGETAADGICSFPGKPCWHAMVVATTGDGRSGAAVQYPRRERPDPMLVEVVVSGEGYLVGSLRAPAGVELPNSLQVVAHLGAAATPFGRKHTVEFVAPVRSGEYRFASLPAATYAIEVRGLEVVDLQLCTLGADGLPVQRPTDGWVQPVMAYVQAGKTTRCDLQAAPAASVAGRVLDEGGRGIPGAVVECRRLLRNGRAVNEGQVAGAPVEVVEESAPAPAPLPIYARTVRTDSEGRYVLSGLVPGPYRLKASMDGFAEVVDSSFDLVGGRRVERNFTLTNAGRVEVVVGHPVVVVVFSDDPRWCRAARTGSNGQIVFDGVPVGRHFVGVIETGDFARAQLTVTDPPDPLASVQVSAAESAFVDLREQLPVVLDAEIIGSDGPWSGARVDLLGRRTVTDGDGRFTLRFGSPIQSEEYLRVTRDGLTLALAMPAASREVRSWRGRFDIATESTTIVARSHDGRPVVADIRLSGGVRGALRTSPADGALHRQLPKRTMRMAATFPSGAVVRRPIRAGETVEVVAPEVTTLRARVVDASNRPQERFQVQVRVWGDPGEPPVDWQPWSESRPSTKGGHGVTDASGWVELRALPAGPAMVFLAPRLGFTGTAPPARVRLEAGRPAEVVLRLDP